MLNTTLAGTLSEPISYQNGTRLYKALQSELKSIPFLRSSVNTYKKELLNAKADF